MAGFLFPDQAMNISLQKIRTTVMVQGWKNLFQSRKPPPEPVPGKNDLLPFADVIAFETMAFAEEIASSPTAIGITPVPPIINYSGHDDQPRDQWPQSNLPQETTREIPSQPSC